MASPIRRRAEYFVESAGGGTWNLLEPTSLFRMTQKQDQGIVQDERGQDQPKDKKRAQQAGLKEQKDAARNTPQLPGEPADGE